MATDDADVADGIDAADVTGFILCLAIAAPGTEAPTSLRLETITLLEATATLSVFILALPTWL